MPSIVPAKERDGRRLRACRRDEGVGGDQRQLAARVGYLHHQALEQLDAQHPVHRHALDVVEAGHVQHAQQLPFEHDGAADHEAIGAGEAAGHRFLAGPARLDRAQARGAMRRAVALATRFTPPVSSMKRNGWPSSSTATNT